MEEVTNACKILVGISKAEATFGDIGINGRIIWALKKEA
jgi:hypothetical protein